MNQSCSASEQAHFPAAVFGFFGTSVRQEALKHAEAINNARQTIDKDAKNRTDPRQEENRSDGELYDVGNS